MKIIVSYLFLFLNLFVVQGIFTQQQTPIVASINPPFGSIKGGTQLSINGANFNSSSLFTQTVVYVGNDQCKIIQHYSTSERLVCITPECNTVTCQDKNIWSGTSTVDISIFVSSVEGILTPITPPVFTYSNGWSPIIYWMLTNTWGTASSPIVVRSDNVALQSIDILFNGMNHASLGTNGELNNEDLPGNSNELDLYFRPPEDMSGGYYNLSMVVQDDFTHGSASTGIAITFDTDRYDNSNYYRFYLYQSSLHGISYSVCLLPSISSISPSLGSIGGGTTVTIKGTGFSINKDLLQVYVGGYDCQVISSDTTTISCITSPKISSSTIYTLFQSNNLISTINNPNIQISPRNQASPGWWFKVWDANDVWSNTLQHDKINFEFGWRQKFYFSLYDYYGWNWYLTTTTNIMAQSPVYAFDAGTIFFAPFAGYYTFYVSSDDYSYLYASSDGMELNEKLLAYNPTYSTSKKFFQFPNKQISTPVPLRKGEKLYLRYRGVILFTYSFTFFNYFLLNYIFRLILVDMTPFYWH